MTKRYEEAPTVVLNPSAEYQRGYSDRNEGNFSDPPAEPRARREYIAGWDRAAAEQLPALTAANEAIDELRGELIGICQPAADALAVAWWHLEDAIRLLTHKCSMGHALPVGDPACGCCNEYQRLRSKAMRRL